MTERNLPGFWLSGGDVEVSVDRAYKDDDAPGTRFEFVVDDFRNQQRFRGKVTTDCRNESTESGIREVLKYLVSLSGSNSYGITTSNKLATLCRNNASRLRFLLSMLEADPGGFVLRQVFRRRVEDSQNTLEQNTFTNAT